MPHWQVDDAERGYQSHVGFKSCWDEDIWITCWTFWYFWYVRGFDGRSRCFFLAGQTARRCGFWNEMGIYFFTVDLCLVDLLFATQLGFERYIKTPVGKIGFFVYFCSCLLETTSQKNRLKCWFYAVNQLGKWGCTTSRVLVFEPSVFWGWYFLEPWNYGGKLRINFFCDLELVMWTELIFCHQKTKRFPQGGLKNHL